MNPKYKRILTLAYSKKFGGRCFAGKILTPSLGIEYLQSEFGEHTGGYDYFYAQQCYCGNHVKGEMIPEYQEVDSAGHLFTDPLKEWDPPQIGSPYSSQTRIPNSGWCRPISTESTIFPYHITANGKTPYVEPKIFDVWKVPILGRAPSAAHPEDWLIDETLPWIREIDGKILYTEEILPRAICEQPMSLWGPDDKITLQQFNTILDPPNQSLLCIAPSTEKNFRVYKRNTSSGQQVRIEFTYGNLSYDLVVTDINFINFFNNQQDKPYPFWIWNKNKKVWTQNYDRAIATPTGYDFPTLVISLGEEFQGHHYKLIAAVIPCAHRFPNDGASEADSPYIGND